MLSTTGEQNRYAIYINKQNTATPQDLANGLAYMNDSQKDILGELDWPFLETVDSSQVTVAGQQYYNLPADMNKNINITVLIGSVLWSPRETTSIDHWRQVNYATNVTSNIPQWYFILNGQVGFWPKPSTGGNMITFTYKKKIIDLSLPDYTTGTIVTATNGTSVIVGSGTSWNQSMAGSYLQIASAPTANAGDNYWYQISPSQPVTATQVYLTSYYKGASITAGTATYTIGQVGVLPENYQIMPVYWAAANYWRLNGNNIPKAQEYERLFTTKLATFKRDHGTKSANPKLDNGVLEMPTINPNLTLTL